MGGRDGLQPMRGVRRPSKLEAYPEVIRLDLVASRGFLGAACLAYPEYHLQPPAKKHGEIKVVSHSKSLSIGTYQRQETLISILPA